jgi:hypothetical protein
LAAWSFKILMKIGAREKSEPHIRLTREAPAVVDEGKAHKERMEA